MSDYFRDRYQGVGAIAASAPAPRSAPAPQMARQRRRGAGGVRVFAPISGRGLGRDDVDDDRPGSSGGGGGTPVRKKLAHKINPSILPPSGPKGGHGTQPPAPPMILVQPVTTITPVSQPATTATTVPLTMLPPKPAPWKTQTAGGGAGSGYSPAALPGYADEMAPTENPTTGRSATTGFGAGGFKLWIALGLAGAGYMAYRHFKKGRRSRR